jgi:hypothetical protein
VHPVRHTDEVRPGRATSALHSARMRTTVDGGPLGSRDEALHQLPPAIKSVA